MLKFAYGPPDEMHIVIACGIAAYLIMFPIVILTAVVCAEVMRRTQSDQTAAARSAAPVPKYTPGVVAADASRREAEVATAV